ncbi:TPA: GIY-YIG nuclease family protein [Vibrio parahaemolyticus]
MNGHVYVLGNESLPGVYKIGGTAKQPEVRAKELSNTSIPTPYEVLLSIEVDDWRKSESFVHESLSEHRVADNREFFSCSLQDIEHEFDRLNKSSKPLNYLIYSRKGGSGSTTVALGLACYYKERGYSVVVSEPDDVRKDTVILSRNFGLDSKHPQVVIRVAPSSINNESVKLLNWAIDKEARVIIPTQVGPNDLDVLYSDILDFRTTKIKPYVLFSQVRYFPDEAKRISECTVTSKSLGAVVLPYTIPLSERFNDLLGDSESKTNPYSLFNVIFEGISLFFDYEDYEKEESKKLEVA